MITIRSQSGMHTLETEQTLPITPDTAWKFFSTPGNLARITPPYMGFRITSGDVDAMYPGQIITYQIGILPGIKSGWVTEITHVVEGRYFVDEQRAGPYSIWHHEHWIDPVEAGVRVRDRVSYKLPFGLLGQCAHPFIKRQLHSIFRYRQEALVRQFAPP